MPQPPDWDRNEETIVAVHTEDMTVTAENFSEAARQFRIEYLSNAKHGGDNYVLLTETELIALAKIIVEVLQP